MSIEELHNKNLLSLRSYEICMDNGIGTLLELRNYYFKHGTFRSLENCGTESTEEFLYLTGLKGIPQNSYAQISELSRDSEEIIPLDLFLNSGKMSRRSRNICLTNGINTLTELRDYKERFGSFRKLDRCGEKINQELTNLCELGTAKEAINSTPTSDALDDFQQDELLIYFFRQGLISKRTFNLCELSDITTYFQLRDFYNIHGNFTSLPGFGPKTNKELKALFRKKRRKPVTPPLKNEKILEVINSLGGEQMKCVEDYIFLGFSKLADSTKNSIFNYLNGNLKLSQITIILDPNFKIGRIPKIKAHSIQELKTWVLSIKDFILSRKEPKSLQEYSKGKDLELQEIQQI